ncbi:MAG: preprotein translocase subunit SecA, partial [Bacteroidota bacterium]
MFNLLKMFFGSKAERDYREIRDDLENTLQTYEEIKKLDNDQLREKTDEFRRRIADHVSEEQRQIDTLKEYLEEHYDIDVNEKEKIYTQIDQLDDRQNQKTEAMLAELLPEAFSV